MLSEQLGNSRKKKYWILSSQWILIRFFKVWSFPFVIQSVYGVLPYLTSVSHHAFPVASLINRQHVMIPRCSNMADPKRPIKLHWKQNNIHAVKVLLKSGMSEYSQTCYKVLTDIQIAFKHQSNSLNCPHCVLCKDTVSQSWYNFPPCNMKQLEIELGIYLYMEKINHWIFYFILFLTVCLLLLHTVCVLSDFYSDFLLILCGFFSDKAE